MTRLALSTALAMLIAAAPLVPASAASRHGSVSVTVVPKGESAEVIRSGYQIYSLFKGLKNRGRVDQRGTGNGAAIGQHGDNNAALVVQRGSGHSATVTQTGRNNLFGVFQFGRNTSTSASQAGNGQTGFVLQGGW
jgi:Curlin associated repeat